jgi:hypothetical protein
MSYQKYNTAARHRRFHRIAILCAAFKERRIRCGATGPRP